MGALYTVQRTMQALFAKNLKIIEKIFSPHAFSRSDRENGDKNEENATLDCRKTTGRTLMAEMAGLVAEKTNVTH